MIRVSTILILPILLLLASAPVAADVLTTTDGLVLEGAASRAEDGRWILETPDGRLVLDPARVAQVEKGEGPRARLARAEAALAEDDVEGWYRLALEAEAAGLSDLARPAYERVVRFSPDHAAARRALGQERVDGIWIDQEVAKRRRGLVLYDGRWMLPAEVEAAARTARAVVATPADVANTREVIRTWATADEPLAGAARVALTDVPVERRLRAALGTLYDPQPKVRAASARLLGEIGDEAALRPLILSGARDTDEDVRREAVLAAASFGHDDTALPFARALGSDNLQLVANAAQALAALGDPRAIQFVVKRLVSHGASARQFVSWMDQVSYVRDYDVEIAQASNIANPDVETISSGVILDVRVLDATYTKTWVEPILVGAASQLAGRRFANRDEVLAWYAANEATLRTFPEEPAGRGPKKRAGKVLGAP